MTPSDSPRKPSLLDSLLNDAMIDMIVTRVSLLPEGKREDVIMEMVGMSLAQMTAAQVVELRAAIVKEYGENTDIPIVVKTLELIDGNLALRQMAAE